MGVKGNNVLTRSFIDPPPLLLGDACARLQIKIKLGTYEKMTARISQANIVTHCHLLGSYFF